MSVIRSRLKLFAGETESATDLADWAVDNTDAVNNIAQAGISSLSQTLDKTG